MPGREAIDQVLAAVQAAGYGGVGEFLYALLGSADHNHRKEETATAMIKWVGSLYKNELTNLCKDQRNRMNARNLGPEHIETFNFPGLARLYAYDAPHLWDLVCGLADVSAEKAHTYMAENDPDDEENERDDDGGRERTPRQKALVATISVGMLAFGRSRNSNRLQGLMGYYLFATRTGKRTIGVLNRLGISTSYSYVNMALRANADRVSATLKARALNSPFFLTYDNMTNHNNVTGETLFNKAVMYVFTTGGVIFNRMPVSLAARIGTSVRELEKSGNLLEND